MTIADQMSMFEPTWDELPLSPRETDPDADYPAYRCPGCGKHPESGGGDHVWDDRGNYLGVLHVNGCCGYQWRTLAKPDDYWSQHARDTAQDADASESNGGDS